MLYFQLFVLTGNSQIQKGVIKDSIGSPIENAYIINTTSQSHAHSNEFGSFSIDKTKNSDILSVSALGYKKKSFTVSSDNFEIVLEDDIYKLEQVVIQ